MYKDEIQNVSLANQQYMTMYLKLLSQCHVGGFGICFLYDCDNENTRLSINSYS